MPAYYAEHSSITDNISTEFMKKQSTGRGILRVSSEHCTKTQSYACTHNQTGLSRTECGIFQMWNSEWRMRSEQEAIILKFPALAPGFKKGPWRKILRLFLRPSRANAAGLRAIEEAKQSGALNTLDKGDGVAMMLELKTEMARNKRAREQFERIPM